MRRTAGFTLIEVLASMVLLTLAFMLVFALFHAALRYSTQIGQQSLATVIATRKLEEIREWSQGSTGTTLNFDTAWAPYAGVTAPDPQDPTFTVHVDVQPVVLESLSTALEAPFPAAVRKLFASSCKKIKVTVSWDPHDASRSVSMVSYVDEPRRAVAATPVVVQPAAPVPVPLARDATAGFSAQLLTASGAPIADVVFQWHVKAETGNGTISSQAHNGSSCTFVNQVTLPNGSVAHTGGACLVSARTVYWGQERFGDYEVKLAP